MVVLVDFAYSRSYCMTKRIRSAKIGIIWALAQIWSALESPCSTYVRCCSLLFCVSWLAVILAGVLLSNFQSHCEPCDCRLLNGGSNNAESTVTVYIQRVVIMVSRL